MLHTNACKQHLISPVSCEPGSKQLLRQQWSSLFWQMALGKESHLHRCIAWVTMVLTEGIEQNLAVCIGLRVRWKRVQAR